MTAAVGAVIAWVLYKIIVRGEFDFTVGSATPAPAAAAAKPAPARRATTPAKRPATAAREPAARKPTPRKK